MNHTITALAIVVVGLLTVITAALIGGATGMLGYLQEVKATTKTYNQTLSTACNGETDESCQTIVCKDNNPCRTIDSNSAQRDTIIVCIDDKPCHTTTKHTP
jgi:hypothetical protein